MSWMPLPKAKHSLSLPRCHRSPTQTLQHQRLALGPLDLHVDLLIQIVVLSGHIESQVLMRV